MITQPKAGYRVNVDAIILAAFARAGQAAPARRTCDLGAGVGAVALALLHLGGSARATLVEADAFAASLAVENARANGFDSRVDVIPSDVLAFAKDAVGAADLVVMNPPYVREGHGRVPNDPRRARAKVGSLDVFVRAARLVLPARGRVCVCYPAPDFVALATSLQRAGLEPKRARFVHASADRAARLVLVEAKPGKAGGLALAPPLVERDSAGLGPELRRLLGPRTSVEKGHILGSWSPLPYTPATSSRESTP